MIDQAAHNLSYLSHGSPTSSLSKLKSSEVRADSKNYFFEGGRPAGGFKLPPINRSHVERAGLATWTSGFSLGLSLDLRPLTLWDSLIFLL